MMPEEITAEPVEPEGTTETQEKPLTVDDVKKLIQSETDKVRTEYSRRLKEKEKELEAVKTEQMSEKEKQAYELQKKEAELADKEKKIFLAELRSNTAKALAESGIALDALDLVVGESEEATTQRVGALKALLDKHAQGVRDEFRQKYGRTPEPTGEGAEFTLAEYLKLPQEKQLLLHKTEPDKVRRLLTGG
jgi:hypothetical protein